MTISASATASGSRERSAETDSGGGTQEPDAAGTPETHENTPQCVTLAGPLDGRHGISTTVLTSTFIPQDSQVCDFLALFYLIKQRIFESL